jgi:hypothetical protein
LASAVTPLDSCRALPQHLWPSLRLFLSADIVGSTAYKQANSHWNADDLDLAKTSSIKKGLHPMWFGPIADFYSDSPALVSRLWTEEVKAHSVSTANPGSSLSISLGRAPELWKTIGDEVCFTKRISHKVQIAATISVWIKYIDEIRKKIRENHDPVLDIKTTAWLAGFPASNTMVVFQSDAVTILRSSAQDTSQQPIRQLDADKDYIENVLDGLKKYRESRDQNNTASLAFSRDFVGPAIDTGFRLATEANPRKFILSADLAYALTALISDTELEDVPCRNRLKNLTFRYDGRKPFKGVLKETPYPVIWIDLAERRKSSDVQTSRDLEVEEKEFELTGKNSRIDANKLMQFSEQFLKAHTPTLCVPYLIDRKSNPQNDWNTDRIPKEHGKVASNLLKIHNWNLQTPAQIAISAKHLSDPPVHTAGGITHEKSADF